jgi:hypothetical protein
LITMMMPNGEMPAPGEPDVEQGDGGLNVTIATVLVVAAGAALLELPFCQGSLSASRRWRRRNIYRR